MDGSVNTPFFGCSAKWNAVHTMQSQSLSKAAVFKHRDAKQLRLVQLWIALLEYYHITLCLILLQYISLTALGIT